MQGMTQAAGHQRIGSIGCRQGSEVGDPGWSSAALLSIATYCDKLMLLAAAAACRVDRSENSGSCLEPRRHKCMVPLPQAHPSQQPHI